jgi:asparagine synthase (glutamine-hydrolysing)
MTRMCGIAGIFDSRGRRAIDPALIRSMTDSLQHRGPDADGYLVEPGIALGHRRLSIIDVSGGDQPIFNEDRSVAVIFNGEIYNFQELTPELQQLGHRFATHSDTETIVHGWEQWGTGCVERFNGMFAFAIWDGPRETLFLARDRIGVKPLYYALLADGQLVFGSELKALLRHPLVRREIDSRAVEDYFAFGYVPDPKTIFASVSKLPPGYWLRCERGGRPQVERYWDVSFKLNGTRSEGDACRELVARLRKSVQIRMISEVPLGAFLSGGVDSSAVVSMMAELSAQPVKTCSIAFGDPAYNEARFAAEVAERYQTDHRVEQVDPEDFSLIDKLATLYDEPFADSSAIPTYRVCQLARRTVTVALSGDGGDENFAGYRRYRWHAFEESWRRLLPTALRRPLFGALGAFYPKLDWAPRFLRAKATLQAIARDTVEGYFHGVSVCPDPLRDRLFSDSFRRSLQGYRAIDVFNEHMKSCPTDHPLSVIQYLDYKTYLPGDIMTKVDRASMAHSLEVREPVLDYTLVDWASGLPPQMKLDGHLGKYIFKKAFEPFLSQEILYRPKMGFGVPIAKWFRGPLRAQVRERLLHGALGYGGQFDAAQVARLVEEHQGGNWDHSQALWALLMFEEFTRQVLV